VTVSRLELAGDRPCIIALGVELGHRALGEVAALGGQPLLVGVEEDGPGQADVPPVSRTRA
jgi:hypothetical protein